jgi:hypothetical protein
VRLDQRLEELRVVDTPDWTKAQDREAIIRDSLQGDGSTTSHFLRENWSDENRQVTPPLW